MDFPSCKLKHNGNAITLRFPEGTRFHVRFPTYREYQIFKSLYDSNIWPKGYLDDAVSTALVDDGFYTFDWLSNRLAGYSTTIADLMMHLGGDHRDEPTNELTNSMLNIARNDAGLLDSVLYSTICRVFSAYTFSILDTLTFPEILRIFACAEKALLDTGAIAEPFEISSGDDSADKPQESGTMVISNDEIRETEREFGGKENMTDIVGSAVEHEKIKRAFAKARAQEKDANVSPSAVREDIERYNKNIADRIQRARKRNQNR